MGGNALNYINVKSKRLDKKDFEVVTSKIQKVFDEIIESLSVSGIKFRNKPHSILAYKSKETFGDLDLLIPKEITDNVSYEEIMNMVANEFNYNDTLPFKERNENDMTFSFGVPSDEVDVFFQVDLINGESENYDFHSKYLNWNDLGNLIGVVASSNGFLKYGHDGIKYQFRDGTHLYKEYVLTTDWEKALVFFGYNVDDYNKGFQSLEDIYKYASSSKFFNKDLYSFESRNHIQRTRDKKRPTYNGFLKWIEMNDFNSIPMDSDKWWSRVLEFFPEFNSEYDKIVSEYNEGKEKKKFLRSYFNGQILAQYKPDLKNEEVGVYLNELKEIVDDFYKFVLLNKENSIKLLIDKKENNI